MRIINLNPRKSIYLGLNRHKVNAKAVDYDSWLDLTDFDSDRLSEYNFLNVQ